MPEKEKISSLHDDFEMPLADKGVPEYDIEKGYPQRHKDTGEKGVWEQIWGLSPQICSQTSQRACPSVI